MLSGLSTGREEVTQRAKGIVVQREREREYGMKGLKRQQEEGEHQKGLCRSGSAFLDGPGHSVMTKIS